MKLSAAMGVMAALAVLAMVVLAIRGRRALGRTMAELRARLSGLAQAHFHEGVLRRITAANGSHLTFVIRREDESTRRMRSAGELVELQTGDATFDARHFLECDDPRLAEWLRGDAEARKLIAALVGNGRELAQHDGLLSTTAADLLAPGHGDVVEHARALHALARRVPDAAGMVDDAVRRRQRGIRIVRTLGAGLTFGALALGSVVYSRGMLGGFPQHVRVLPLLVGAGLAGAALATFAYRAALRRVRDSSHAPRLAVELSTTLWVPIAILVVLAIHQVNLRVPLHEVHEESSEILARGWSTGRRGGTRYWFELPALGGGEVPAARYSSGAQNAQYEPGMPVVVRWRKGPLASYVLLSAPVPAAPRVAADP